MDQLAASPAVNQALGEVNDALLEVLQKYQQNVLLLSSNRGDQPCQNTSAGLLFFPVDNNNPATLKALKGTLETVAKEQDYVCVLLSRQSPVTCHLCIV